MSITSISSLPEFLQWHEEQKLLLRRYNRFEHIYDRNPFQYFFRGMSAWNYGLEPSIYRSIPRLQNEDKIIADCLAQRPQDFRDDKSTFERLVRMQHYGIPTRLLDVTRSPLVALYFAVQGDEGTGKLTTIFVAPRNIKYADSDTISSVANIANMPYQEWSSFCSCDRYCQYLATRAPFLKQEYLNEYNKRHFLQKLHQQILREKPYFQARLEKDDLERVWCVIPPMNNERIRRQQGAFLLFGAAGKKKHCIEIIEKDTADLLLDAADMLETLAIGSPKDGGILFCDEEKRDMILKSVDNLSKYFRRNPIEICSLSTELNKLSPSANDFGDDVRAKRDECFQQIVQNSIKRIITAEANRSENAYVIDLEDLIRFKFFYDFIYQQRAVFQTSVEVYNKSSIRHELKNLGITKSYLFPDLSSVADEIKARYPTDDEIYKLMKASEKLSIKELEKHQGE